MIHLKNRLSGYTFCKTKKPNIFSPNVTVIGTQLGHDKEQVCPFCRPYYDRYKKMTTNTKWFQRLKG